MNQSFFTETTQFKVASNKQISVDKHTTIPSIDEILDEVPVDKNDPSKGTKVINRKIRYVPGESSIYADEQSDNVNEKQLKPIIMIGYQMFVSKSELLKTEYLKKSNFNKNNPLRKREKSVIYFEYDREAEYKKAVNKEVPAIEAKAKVLGMHIAELKALIMINSKNYSNISDLDRLELSELKHACLYIAEKSPDLINEGLKTKTQRNKYLILQGVNQGILMYDERQEMLKWANGDLIVKSPLGNNAIDYFVESTLNDNIEVDEVMDEIKRRVSFDIQSESDSAIEKSMEMLLLEKAVKLGLVTIKGNWHTYINTEDEKEVKTNGATLFVKELEDDDELFSSLKNAVKYFKK